MAAVLKLCPKCKKENNTPFSGYYPFMSEDAICSHHSMKMQTVNIDMDDYITILTVSDDVSFLEAMISLKETNIIEYNLKMSQFKANLSQTQTKQESSNQIKCPTCSSINIEKISATSKVAGAVTFGLFSKAARSQFKCKNCGAKW